MSFRGRASLLVAGILLASACTSAATPAPPTAAPPTAAPPSTGASGSATPPSAAPATPIAGGLLDKVIKAGKLIVSTDPNYAPQSIQKKDGTYEGFDIDVATEVAKRLG